MSHPTDPRPGSRLGIADRVSPGWSGYARSETERHSREIHYEVLRESGFGPDHAAHIAAASSEEQAHLLDRHRGERPHSLGRVVNARREPPEASSRAADDLFGSFLAVLAGGDADGDR